MEICIKWNVCRVCLEEEQKQQPKGEKNNGCETPAPQMRNLFHDKKLAKQIFICSGITMKPGDSMPDKICHKCLTQLSRAISFRSNCRNSNEYLESVLQKTRSAASLIKLDRRREQSHLVDDVIEQMFDIHAEGENDLHEILGDSDKRKHAPSCETLKSKNKKPKMEAYNSSPAGSNISMEDISTQHSENEHFDTGKAVKNSDTVVLVPGSRGDDTNEQQDYAANAVLVENEEQDEIEENDLDEGEVEVEESECKKAVLPKITSVCSIEDDDFAGTEEEFIEALEPRKLLKDYHRLDDNADDVEEGAGGDKILSKLSTKSRTNDDDEQPDGDDEFGVESEGGDAENKLDENEYFYLINDIKREHRVNSDDTHKTLDSGYEVIQIDGQNYVDDETEDRLATNQPDELDETDDIEFIIDGGGHQKEAANLIDEVDNEEANTNVIPVAITGALQSAVIINRKRNNAEDRKNFTCDICGNQFTNRSLMNYHMRTHRSERTFECELCYKKFNASCNLNAHMRIHTGEKPYECKFCGRRFRDRSTHIKHERVHTNEKPFECDTCGKAFSLSTTLRAHEKVHTNEKPYQCLPCAKYFKLAHQLKAHYNTHQHKLLQAAEERIQTY